MHNTFTVTDENSPFEACIWFLTEICFSFQLTILLVYARYELGLRHRMASKVDDSWQTTSVCVWIHSVWLLQWVSNASDHHVYRLYKEYGIPRSMQWHNWIRLFRICGYDVTDRYTVIVMDAIVECSLCASMIIGQSRFRDSMNVVAQPSEASSTRDMKTTSMTIQE
jgi:hypothetical protein